LYGRKVALINKAISLQRPESVKIEAQDTTGAKIKLKLSGLPARVFQHEFDHLLVCIQYLPGPSA
jgi:peptide deformylase